jgi:hydroxymethylpyrimidine/phosphomethylpyrimidine kinase
MTRQETTIPRVLIVAGSDSSGGAGIQADLKTVSALGAYGMTAITAVTAQNTTGVFEIFEIDARFIALQMEVCFEDVGCDAVKTGMLFNAGTIEVVAEILRKYRPASLVVDPVMNAKDGTALLKPAAAEALKTKLLPLVTLLAPNLHEASVLAGREVKTLDQMREAARAISGLGADNVVIKGGHLEGIATDVLFDGRSFVEYRAERIQTKNSHGTGCIFASAIAACLAKKMTVRESVAVAKDFVTTAIREGFSLGSGCGPANPMFSRKAYP